MIYDLVVVGLGGMGSSVAAHAARRGRRVLGVEQFARGHALGASSGRSRVIRKAYYEHPAYVPLLVRAYELWHELQATSAAPIIDLVGLLTVGSPDSEMLVGAERSAHLHDLPLERFDSEQIRRRFRGTSPLPGEVGLFERDAGMVFPEAAVAAHLALAESAGAELRFDTAVEGYENNGDGLSVVLADGSAVKTARLALCAGPWLEALVTGLALDVRIQRNVQVWFKQSTRMFAADRFPAFFIYRPNWPAAMYGFPDYGFGVKAALHRSGDDTSPDRLDREMHDVDVARVRDALDAWMPGSAGEFLEGKACMYTLTPDEHFIVDQDPRDPRVVIAGGFSGHGFKFASVIGEIVADLAFDGGTRHPIDFLALDRFAKAAPSSQRQT